MKAAPGSATWSQTASGKWLAVRADGYEPASVKPEQITGSDKASIDTLAYYQYAKWRNMSMLIA